MECPFCNTLKYRASWSDPQWNKGYPNGSPYVVVNGMERNCCKDCSDHKGWYFRATVAETDRGSQPDEPNIRCAADEEEGLSKKRAFSVLTPPPSATCPLTQAEAMMSWIRASEWLQKNVSVEFWRKAESWWIDKNLEYRTEIEEINAARALSREKSLMNHFSYWGTAKVDDWAKEWSAPGHPGNAVIRVHTRSD